MPLTLRYAARSDVGLLREGNEDSVYAGPRLLAVADGMGGHAAGEVASRVVVATLAPLDEDVPDTDLIAALHRAIETAQQHLRDLVAGDSALEGMGTTLTALLSAGNRVALVHIGDSRAYLLRDGELHQITHDHTYVQDLVDAGRISAAEADSHPQRSLLTRALDGRNDVEPDFSIREVRPGDRFLLCTDGLSGVVSDETLCETLTGAPLHEAADALVELALRGGGPDNITCIVADIVSGEVRPEPVVVAGAASDVVDERADPDTPAGRAALATRRPRKPGSRAVTADGESPPRRRGLPRGGVLAGVLLAVVVLAVAGVGGWVWVRGQYYVGDDSGQVAIYHGIPGRVVGLALSDVVERPGIPVAALPQFEQDRLRQGISASSLAMARQVVARLRIEGQPPCPPVRSGTPQPTPCSGSAP